MTVQLDDAHAQALTELVKNKVADLMRAQDDLQKKIREWENICAALVTHPVVSLNSQRGHPVDSSPQGQEETQIIAAPAPTTMLRPTTLPPGGAGADVKEEGAESVSTTLHPSTPSSDTRKTKKSSGRFPYRDSGTQMFSVGKNMIWFHGDCVAIGRRGYDKKARLTLAELQTMDEEKLRFFSNDKARAILRLALNEVDFSSMPPVAKAGAGDAVQKPPEKSIIKIMRNGKIQLSDAGCAPITEVKCSVNGQKMRAGSSGYIICPEGLAVSRDGYHHHVYLSYPDFFTLVEHPEQVDVACAAWHKLKRSLLRGFLGDVTPEVVAQIRKARAEADPDEWKYKKIVNVDTKVPKEDYAKLEGVL